MAKVPNSSCEIAVLISGGGSNLQSIINHIQENHINASIACVISNEPSAYGLTRAEQANIPTHTIEHNNHATQEEFDAELIKTLAVYNINLIVLAGFMRILSPNFINEYQDKILNIHPSLLPKYTGLHTHARVLKANESKHGCSVHFVTAELDKGPLILQAKVDVKSSDTPDLLAERVLKKEHIIYPLVVKWFCEKRLNLIYDKVHFDGSPLEEPMLLSPEHEKELQ